MGLLSLGTPLRWEEAAKYADHVRTNGIEQLLNAFNRVQERPQDGLRWGDEVEYLLVKVDPESHSARVTIRAEEVLASLHAEMKQKMQFMSVNGCCQQFEESPIPIPSPLDESGRRRKSSDTFTAIWHPEYARYMLESTPAYPYGESVQDLLCVEKSMRMRRLQVEGLLKHNERLLSMGNFPRLGCTDAFVNANGSDESDSDSTELVNEASHSLFFPDNFISSHARFK